ncbi:ceramidase domain-containing protein [Flexivirga meconopsidis]|uniref:ceramidase domain-containing protein n=1 Tax=Flexivirga meconopsidis TaxID=2977121 RepID=UPI0022405C32|nr:ceramidase domain-containing protein [Flexivirga meconopsidis]
MQTPGDRWPLAAAAVTAVVSVGLLAAAVAGGWLGADIGAGSGFCEAARDSLVRQPANTWSNLGFVVAGLVIAARAAAPGRPPTWLATGFACLVVLLGPGSAAMHATQTAAGGRLDVLSMFLVASFAASYMVMRVVRGGATVFVACFVAGLVLCEIAERVPGEVPLFMTWANVAFGGLLLAAAVGELALHHRQGPRTDLRWGVAALAALATAFAVWSMAKDGGPLCRPHSLLQGHALWHLMCAVAAWCLYRLWASERV